MTLEDFVCPKCGEEQPTIHEVYGNVLAYAEVTYASSSDIQVGHIEIEDADITPYYVCEYCGETIANSPEEFMALFRPRNLARSRVRRRKQSHPSP